MLWTQLLTLSSQVYRVHINNTSLSIVLGSQLWWTDQVKSSHVQVKSSQNLEEVAERRARATDGKEAEVVAVAGRWEGLAA